MQSLLPVKERLLLWLSPKKQQVSKNWSRESSYAALSVETNCHKVSLLDKYSRILDLFLLTDKTKQEFIIIRCQSNILNVFFKTSLQVFWFHYEAPSRPEICLPCICVWKFYQTSCRVSRVSCVFLGFLWASVGGFSEIRFNKLHI